MSEHEFSSPTSDETCYFSALEEIQPDEQSPSQQTIDSLDSEHYYTQLRLDKMASRTYFTIEVRNKNNESVYQIDIDGDIVSTKVKTQNDSKINEKKVEPEHDDTFEPKFISTRIDETTQHTLDGTASNKEMERILEELTAELETNFENKIKSSNLRHRNLDLVIEDTLDETRFEDVTDSLIQSVAAESHCHSRMSDSFNSDELNDTLNRTKNEMSLIKHSFFLVNRINLSSMGQVYHQFLKKLEIMTETAGTKIRRVAKIFRDLFSYNFQNIISNLSLISFTDRWNVVKNMLYYSTRMILLRISSLYRSDSIINSTAGTFFNQIISYIRNFQYLHY